MSRRLVSTTFDVCEQIYLNGESPKPPPSQQYGNGAVVIGASVGIGGNNLPNDVTTIQDALNRVSPANGGASPPLAVDGNCGPKTRDAIQQFQLNQFGWSGADGKINPGGQTITRLNELLGSSRPMEASEIGHPFLNGPSDDDIFKAAMTTGLLVAKKWIYAAQANLDIARFHVNQPATPGPIPSLGREERMRLTNRYFRIDEFNKNQRTQILQKIRVVFSTMLQMYERPGGLWGEKAFEIDSTGVAFKENRNAKAHTVMAGFFNGGKPNPFQKELRGDSIFFVRENMAYFRQMDRGVKTIVHEMAHFCGDVRSGWGIDDFGAYGEPDEPRVARLTLAQRIRHADTYARFARAAGK